MAEAAALAGGEGPCLGSSGAAWGWLAHRDGWSRRCSYGSPGRARAFVRDDAKSQVRAKRARNRARRGRIVREEAESCACVRGAWLCSGKHGCVGCAAYSGQLWELGEGGSAGVGREGGADRGSDAGPGVATGSSLSAALYERATTGDDFLGLAFDRQLDGVPSLRLGCLRHGRSDLADAVVLGPLDMNAASEVCPLIGRSRRSGRRSRLGPPRGSGVGGQQAVVGMASQAQRSGMGDLAAVDVDDYLLMGGQHPDPSACLLGRC